MDYTLTKFEANRMVQKFLTKTELKNNNNNTSNKNIFLTNFDAILQDVSVPETIVNGKLIIFILAPNMADPTSIKHSVLKLIQLVIDKFLLACVRRPICNLILVQEQKIVKIL